MKIKENFRSLFNTDAPDPLISGFANSIDSLNFDKAIATLKHIQSEATAFIHNYEEKANEK
jgi:hypothetical protein